MSLIRLRNGVEADADRDSLARFLSDRALSVHEEGLLAGCLKSEDGNRLLLDGHETSLRVDYPDSSDTISGDISHAHLGDEETAFIFDLCVAAGFLVVNHQGGQTIQSPMFIVPVGNHGISDLTGMLDLGIRNVDDRSELIQLLIPSFSSFGGFRKEVVTRPSGPEIPPR